MTNGKTDVTPGGNYMVFQLQTMQLLIGPALSSSAGLPWASWPPCHCPLIMQVGPPPPHEFYPLPLSEPYLHSVFTQHWPDVGRNRIDLCDVRWASGREALQPRRRDLWHKTTLSEQT